MRDLFIKKLYYSISEVSKITDLEQYVLRYWESEFDELKPAKNRAGNRIYTNRDIRLILYIKKLLREERYTIEGAKQVLKSYHPDALEEEIPKSEPVAESGKPSTAEERPHLDERLRGDVLEVRRFLEELLVKLR